MTRLALTIALIFTGTTAYSAIQPYRWTRNAALTDSLPLLLEKLNVESGQNLTVQNFKLSEERDLANSHFKTYVQLAEGVAIKGALIRTWSDLATQTLIQMEAHIDDGSLQNIRLSTLKLHKLSERNLKSQLNGFDNMTYVNKVVLKHSDDPYIGRISFQDQWDNADLIRVIKVKGRRGVHEIVVSHFAKKIVSATYKEHPQFDVPALVYPIYEESEKNKIRQQRMTVMLKNLSDTRRLAGQDPYSPLRSRHYFEDKIDPILGETPEGQAQGYWSPNWLLRSALALYEALPLLPNTFENGGFYLQGRYATVNLHPAVRDLQGLTFTPNYSGQLTIMWKSNFVDGIEKWEIIPTGALNGRPLASIIDAFERPARRLPNHDIVSYINDGFDEIQVYYAIDRLMESLHGMGFSDPELSTRAFHAFLYDPDISMRDNAYYTNDTINFTTYSPDALNYARDNSTIWHELGHGIMDRLMGDLITLADSGGLSEGMADFIAQLVIQDVTNGESFEGSSDFRIINRTGFNLTNESHDDGEAYGGAMNDILVLAMQRDGRQGLLKMTDLTLEAMRLTRNHPALTANDWFEHMLYADELGRTGVRESGELKDLILQALSTRNFRLDRGPVAEFMVRNGDTVLTESSPGSRAQPILHNLSGQDEASHELELALKSSEFYQFKYPVTVEVHFNGGPLQGAVKWKNEDKGPLRFILASSQEKAVAKLTAIAGCDFINREDGTCSDFAYIQVFNDGDTRPFAKKRFYLRVGPSGRFFSK